MADPATTSASSPITSETGPYSHHSYSLLHVKAATVSKRFDTAVDESMESPGAAQHPVDMRADWAGRQTGYQEQRGNADEPSRAFHSLCHLKPPLYRRATGSCEQRATHRYSLPSRSL